MTAFTARELRLISDHLETLTKARKANADLGIPTTPDIFTARFHTGLYAVLRWRPAISSDKPGKQAYIQNTARNRDSYQLDLGTAPDIENALPLRDPWQNKRDQRAMRAAVVANAPVDIETLARISGDAVRGNGVQGMR